MSGTLIANLPPATLVNSTDLAIVEKIGSPNITERATVAQILANALLLAGGGTILSSDAQNFIQLEPPAKNAVLTSDEAQIFSQFNSSVSGGASGSVASNARIYTSVYGAPNSFLWSLLGVLDYDGTGGTGQHVAVYGQALRRTFAAGGAANNPQVWAATFESRDLTNQPSSVTGAAQLGVEIDILANGLDDAKVRQGLAIIVGKAQTGAAAFAGTGLGLYSADGTSGFGAGIFLGFPFTTAGIDFRTSTKTSGHSIWFANGHDLALDTAGTTVLYYDPAIFAATGGARISGKLQVDGQLFTPSIEVVGGLLTAAAGAAFSGGPVSIDGNFNFRLTSQTDGAGAFVGSLNNSPAAGNPGFWLALVINGVNCHIPVWTT